MNREPTSYPGMTTMAEQGRNLEPMSDFLPRLRLTDVVWALFWGLPAAGGIVHVGYLEGRLLWAIPLGLVGVALMLFRRTLPLVSSAGLLLVLVLHALILNGVSLGALIFVGVVAYTSRRWIDPRRGVLILAALVAGSAGYLWAGSAAIRDTVWSQRLFMIGWALALIAVCALVGELRRRSAQESEREMDRLRLELALQREQFERRSMEQRTFIAREVHDIVAHTLGTIVAQADGGRYATDPEQSREALAAIGRVGRTSLRQMRGLIGVLRDGEGRALNPGVTHEDLADLIDEVTAGGVEVRWSTHGDEPAEVPEDVSLVLYRIVQEALTNVRKHGSSPSAEVVLTWAAHVVTVTVTNPIDAAPNTDRSSGHGITGLSERVALVDGTLTAGPDAGQWRVHAELPLEAS